MDTVRRSTTLLAALAGAALACSCGGARGGDVAATCSPGSAGVTDDTTLPSTLDAFCQVSIVGASVTPATAAVVPYDLNTPLFSDYAVKFRTLWLPPGASAKYAATGPLEFPTGTVLTKSFGWPSDFRNANAPVHWLETRVIVKTPDHGWTGGSYEWNEAQTKATLMPGGDVRSFSFVGADGTTEKPTYLVPSQAQCPKCHANDGDFTPLGPSAAQLNRAYQAEPGGPNQLASLSRNGMLTGAPAAAVAPRLPVWDDPATGTTERRARAYLQANCAYCHDGRGEARTTGLVLSYDEVDPTKYGVCKPPVAAGKAAGHDQFDVVPREPDESILIRRVTLTAPGIAMPEIGRSLEHKQGVALLADWIRGLSGDCAR